MQLLVPTSKTELCRCYVLECGASWSDVAEVCNDCKVLVDNFDNYNNNCNDYCIAQGLECIGAWEEVANSCDQEDEWSCSDVILGSTNGPTSDAICQCAEGSGN